VSGSNNVGGLVGQNYGFAGGAAGISNSNASGSVTGGGTVGGLVGMNFAYGSGSSATISSSNATGAVTGISGVGGLVGRITGLPAVLPASVIVMLPVRLQETVMSAALLG